MLENRCDVHTHTVASRHAYSTVEENVRAASERGVDLLGVTDHFSCMTSVGVQTDGTGADIQTTSRSLTPWFGRVNGTG